jgi:hypothetical protein
MNRLLTLLALVALASPALAEEAAPAAAPAAEPPAAEDPAAKLAALFKEIDDTYLQKRDQPGIVEELEKKLSEAEALGKEPAKYDVTWRRARLQFWKSEMAPNDEKKAELAKIGWDLGEAAVKLKPAGGEGHYYAGICAGNYGDAIGVAKALMKGVEEPFTGHVNEAVRKVPALDAGGPSNTMGRYYFKLPWPKHDGKKSEEILRAVVKSFPRNTRAKYYLAETLLDEDKPEEAKKLLDEVLAGGPGRDPPDERLVRKWAKALLPKVEEELK